MIARGIHQTIAVDCGAIGDAASRVSTLRVQVRSANG